MVVRYLPLVMFVLVDLNVGLVVTLFLIYQEAESDIYIYEIICNNFPLFSFSLSMCDSTIVGASSLCLISTIQELGLVSYQVKQ